MLLSEMCDGSHSFILVFLWDVRWFSQCHLGAFVRCAILLSVILVFLRDVRCFSVSSRCFCEMCDGSHSAILVFLWDVWWFSQCHLGVFVRCAMVLTVSSWCFCENKRSNLTHSFPIHFFFGNKCVNPFYPNVSFLWPLKTSEKHWSSMVFMLKNCIPVSSEQ